MKLNIHQIFEQISADIFVIKEQNQNSCTITRVRKFLPETTVIDSDTLYLIDYLESQFLKQYHLNHNKQRAEISQLLLELYQLRDKYFLSNSFVFHQSMVKNYHRI